MIYDKRKLKRIDIFLIVEFKPLKKAATHSVGITRNLSCEGFSLESQSFDFGHGEILDFRLKHPQIDLSVTVLGEIVWKKQGWYKYATGIKFHEVNEETKSKILQLISAVSDMAGERVPDSKDPEGIPAVEKDEKPEVRDVAGKTDEVPDTSGISNKDIYLKEVGRGETPGAESTIVPGDEVDRSGEEVIEETESAERDEETEIDPPQTSDFQVEEVKDKGLQVDTAQATCDDITTTEKGQKKKIRFYIPVAMIVVIIFMLALPVALKEFNENLESFSDSTFSQDIDKEEPVFATGNTQTGGQTFEEPFERLQVQPDQEKESVLTEQEGIVNLEQSSAKQDMTGDMTFDLPSEPELKSEGKPWSMYAVEIEKITKPEPDAKKEKILKAKPVVKSEKASGNEVIKKIAKPKKTKPDVRAKKTVKAKVRAKSKKVIKIKAAVKSVKPSKAETVVKSEETLKAEVSAKSKKPPKTKPAEKSDQIKNPEPVVKAETTPKAELIAKLQEPLKTEPVEKVQKREKPVKTGTVVTLSKFPEIALIVKHEKPQKNQGGSITGKSKVANTVLSEKWKKIGSTKNGIPLLIDTETISYPSEHIVKLSMKASINKKEFIGLLEIDCLQIQLRIVEERLEKNPLLSPYSTGWRDIIPESMLLYEAVCSKKNRN